MKKLLVFSLLLLSIQLKAQILNRGAIVKVAEDSIAHPIWPRLIENHKGEVVVVYGYQFKPDLFISFGSNGTFTTPRKVNNHGQKFGINELLGPELAVGANNLYLAFKGSGDFTDRIKLIHSGDGGHTLDSAVDVFPGTNAYYANVSCSDDGKYVYVALMIQDTNTFKPQYAVATSSDYGKTFANPVIVSDTSHEVCDCCPSDIVANNNVVVIAYRANNNNQRDIWCAVSTDYGKTFSSPKDIDKTDWYLGGCPSSGPSLMLTPDDTISTVWMSSEKNQALINVSTFNIGTEKNGIEHKLTPGRAITVGQNAPIIDGDNNHKMVVWHESNQGSHATRLIYSHVGVEGLQEHKLERLDDSTGLSSFGRGPQYPFVSFKDGRFHTTWINKHTKQLNYRLYEVQNYSNVGRAEAVEVRVYPNPVRTILHLENPISGSYSVYDVLGRRVITGELRTEYNITVESLSPGSYHLVIISSKKVATTSFHKTP